MLGIQGVGTTAVQMNLVNLPCHDQHVPPDSKCTWINAVAQDGLCSPQRLINASWKEHSSCRCWKLGRQSVPGLCHSFSSSLKWINWPLEGRLPLVLKEASLCHVIARHSLCCWKSLSKTLIPLHLQSLIYQPTPQRRNTRMKTFGCKTLLCIMLCGFCV